MRIVVNDLGPAPKQVPRNENKPVQLPLFSRWETQIPGEFFLPHEKRNKKRSPKFFSTPFADLTNSLKAMSTANEVLYVNTRSLILNILRSLPPQKTKALSLKAVIDVAINFKTDQNILRKGLLAAENLRKLEQEGLVSSDDNYSKLTTEVGEVGKETSSRGKTGLP